MIIDGKNNGGDREKDWTEKLKEYLERNGELFIRDDVTDEVVMRIFDLEPLENCRFVANEYGESMFVPCIPKEELEKWERRSRAPWKTIRAHRMGEMMGELRRAELIANNQRN